MDRKGFHPKSQANLEKGRKTFYEEAKKGRLLMLTETADEGLKRMAQARGLSKSELVERIGRELIKLVDDL